MEEGKRRERGGGREKEGEGTKVHSVHVHVGRYLYGREKEGGRLVGRKGGREGGW